MSGSHAPDDSSLLVLPFYAFVADYQRQHGNGQGGALKFWITARVAHHAHHARRAWAQVSGSLGHDWQTEFRRLRDAACRQGARYR
ncbi:hypothetical protein ACWKT3_00820 [Streptomyces violaceus]